MYLSIFTARYECKSCGDVRIHLTQFHGDLHVEAATIHVPGTLHATLSHVWKAFDVCQSTTLSHVWKAFDVRQTLTELRLESLRRPSDSH